MKKPKILYRYDLNKTVRRVKIEKYKYLHHCEKNKHGDLWLYANSFHQHNNYGYGSLREAILEEISETKEKIISDKNWLKKAKGKTCYKVQVNT